MDKSAHPLSKNPSKYFGSIKCSTALSKSSLPGLDYTINPYYGCEHGCLYCYVPDVLRKKELLDSWGYNIYAKENISETLLKQIRTLKPGVVGFSTVTDAYQPYESKMCLARTLIDTLLKYNFKISFQTKSSLISRDEDIIRGENVEVGFTITSLNNEFAQTFEPYASKPEGRAQALERFSSQGVKTWIFYGPIIPNYNDNDETIRGIMSLAKRTKSRLLYDKLNLKPILSKRLSENIGNDKVSEIIRLVKEGYMDKVYSKVVKVGREFGVPIEPAFP